VQTTSRFFPRRLPRELFAGWSAEQRMTNREYNAAAAALLGLLGLKLRYLC